MPARALRPVSRRCVAVRDKQACSAGCLENLGQNWRLRSCWGLVKKVLAEPPDNPPF